MRRSLEAGRWRRFRHGVRTETLRVEQGCGRPGLVDQTRTVGLRGDRIRRQKLEGYRSVEGKILGLVDDTHPTLTKLGEDLIMRDRLTDHSFPPEGSWRRAHAFIRGYIELLEPLSTGARVVDRSQQLLPPRVGTQIIVKRLDGHLHRSRRMNLYTLS